METPTRKAIRRAQIKLLAKAGREKISIVEAVLRILETEDNSDLVQNAFPQKDKEQSPALTREPEIPDY